MIDIFNPPPDAVECEWCHGYGSSLKDPDGVDTCTRCGGSGLVRATNKETTDAR